MIHQPTFKEWMLWLPSSLLYLSEVAKRELKSWKPIYLGPVSIATWLLWLSAGLRLKGERKFIPTKQTNLACVPVVFALKKLHRRLLAQKGREGDLNETLSHCKSCCAAAHVPQQIILCREQKTVQDRFVSKLFWTFTTFCLAGYCEQDRLSLYICMYNIWWGDWTGGGLTHRVTIESEVHLIYFDTSILMCQSQWDQENWFGTREGGRWFWLCPLHEI